MMDLATSSSGLDDFGPGDFREGLDVLLQSLATDARLDPSTDHAVVGVLQSRLTNRLLVEDWYRRHPEIDDIDLDSPVHVIGLPRTGTTALGSMLSLDPQLRGLRMWEQRNPVPPPVLDGELEDPRRLAYAAEIAALPPAAHALHHYEVDASVEDSDVLGMAFHGQQYTLPAYGYHRWWRTADSTQSFQYHRRVVKLLTSRRPPNRWLFKAPHLKFHLDAVVAAYPDARFVMTHRDPARSIPSYASLVSSIFPAAADPAGHDLTRLGPEVSNHLRDGIERAIAARARIGEDRFLDIHHEDLNADPLGTVARVYDFIGLTLEPGVEQVIDQWQRANRSGGKGAHRYTPEQFGLCAEQIRDDFDAYIRRFDVRVSG
ncbi:MAG: sulfotransferase family protein [Ilumatobacteraceae bacterium]|nr:sulfotransferase family protein [Ilumatobacteraceae bacterium]